MVRAQTTATWNGSIGNWSDATRWSSNPNFPDNQNPGAPYNAIINSGTVTLDIAGLDINTLTLGGGTVTGANDLTLSAGLSASGGTMSGAGATILQGASTITGLFGLDVGRVLRVENTLNWTSGNIDLNRTSAVGSGTLRTAAGGTFLASGDNANSVFASFHSGSDTGASALFDNLGTFRKSGSTAGDFTNVNVLFNNTGSVDVQTGVLGLSKGGTHSGTFQIAQNAELHFGGGTHTITGAFTGAGTLAVTGGTVNWNSTFNNTGTVKVQGGGVLRLNGGGTHSGSFQVAQVAQIGELRFGGGTHTITGGFTGAGTLAVAGGTVNWNAPFNVAGLTRLSGGTLSIAGVGQSSMLTQSGGVLMSTSDFIVTGAAALSGGTHSGAGATILQEASTLAGFSLDAGRVLQVENTLTWNASGINLNGGSAVGSGTLRTAPGGTFVVSGNSTNDILAGNFVGDDASALFENLGTFRKSGTSFGHLTTVGVAFNNTGSVDVQTDVLSLSKGGTHSGSFQIAQNAELRFGGGTHTITGAFTGAGTLAVTSGTVNWNTDLNVAGLTRLSAGMLSIAGASQSGMLSQTNGILVGAGDFTVTGAAALGDGIHSGPGTTILQGPSTLTGTVFSLDAGRVLRVENTLTWSRGHINLNGNAAPGSGTLRIAAGGTFVALGDNTSEIFGGTFGGSEGLFDNLGTFRRSGGTFSDVTTIRVAFNNAGTVDVQGGTLVLSGGGTHTGNFGGTGTIRFAGGTHILTADTDVTTSTVTVAGGTANFGGTVNIGTTTVFSGGAANFTGTITSLGDAITIAGGAVNLGAANLSLETLTQTFGTLGGTGIFTVSGAATLSGSHTGVGTTILQGASGGGSIGLDSGRVLRVENTLSWSGGNIDLNHSSGAGSGTLRTAPGGTLVVSGDNIGDIFASDFGGDDTGESALFDNLGTFRKSNGVVNADVDVAINNTGVVDVQTGVVSLNRGGTHSGDFQIAQKAYLHFGGGTHTFTPTSSFAGAGTLRFTAGTSHLNSSGHTVAAFNVTGGTLNINVSQTLNGLNISGNGVVRMTSSAPSAAFEEIGYAPDDAFASINDGGPFAGETSAAGQAVPEPGSTLLTAGAGVALVLRRFRKSAPARD